MKAACISIFLTAPLAFTVFAFPDYPAKPAKDCRVTAERSGVVIGLDPIETSVEQKMYFGAELARKGFIPVFVVIENGMSSDSAIFDKGKVTYGSAASTLSSVKTGTGAGKALVLSAIPFFGGFAGAQAISEASQIQNNLLKKELQSATLSPGTSTHGFLYIPINKNAPREKIALRVAVTKSGTDETFDLDFVF